VIASTQTSCWNFAIVNIDINCISPVPVALKYPYHGSSTTTSSSRPAFKDYRVDASYNLGGKQSAGRKGLRKTFGLDDEGWLDFRAREL
jgi:hypothetical protein